MVKSSLLIDLDDPRTDEIADAISNKTAKQILTLLGEGELSESDIAKKLGILLNTIDYNIKKLEHAGLIEKAKTFSWSSKGKAIYRYRLSDKKIVISPRSLVRGVVPALLIGGFFAFLIKVWFDRPMEKVEMLQKSAELGESGGSAALPAVAMDQASILVQANPWAWFALGAVVGILVIVVWNNLKK